MSVSVTLSIVTAPMSKRWMQPLVVVQPEKTLSLVEENGCRRVI